MDARPGYPDDEAEQFGLLPGYLLPSSAGHHNNDHATAALTTGDRGTR